MSQSRPWMLEEVTLAEVRREKYQVAVLPLGATEPHNHHLPYGTDTFEARAIGEAICAAAWKQEARVVLLPAIPYGTETNMRELPLAMNLQPTTVLAVVTDLVRTLAQAGIHKILLLNSHGGNDLKWVLRQLYGSCDAHLFLCDWFRMVRDIYPEIFEVPEDHAGEMETSLGLAYFGHLVRHDEQGRLRADEGRVRATRFEAIEQGWVSITRPWHLLTTQSGSGNPHAAAEAKGRRLMEVLVERLAPFLVELSHSPLDTDFPFATAKPPASGGSA